MHASDAQVATGHSLDLQELPSGQHVQSMREDALLTTVLMEHGHPVEGDPMSQPLDADLRHSAEAYALKSSPDHGYTGYSFKSGQDMMLQAELGDVPVDQPLELVPIQVVPSQGPMEAFSPNGYHMGDIEGSSFSLACAQSKPMQGGQVAGQQFVSKGASETSLRRVGHTPTQVDANGRPTKMLVHRARSMNGAQAGLGVYRSVARVSRTMSDSDIVLESPLDGHMGSGAVGHAMFPGMGSVVHAGGRMGSACLEAGDRMVMSGKEGTKTRWKPNPVQLCLLEQHFNSGYTKATPELHAAVQGAGHATENQVTVWLKNRLSRCKRPPPKAKQNDAMKVEEEESDSEAPWEDFSKVSTTVLEELSSILCTVNKQDIVTLAKSIRSAKKIGCCGVGREGLVMRALACSLHHLGFEVYCTGDTNMPPFGADDLMLVSAGPSFYSSVSAIALEAMRAHAVVIAFTAHKTADLPFAEHVIRIPAQTLPPSMPAINQNLNGTGTDLMSFLPEGRVSILQMGASYEMSMWLMFECVSIMLRKACHVSPSDMRARHTNLE